MSKFKIGDIVTGNELNHYGFTNALATCKVVRVRNDALMDVVILKHPTYSGDLEFLVASKKFKLVRSKFKGNN